MAQHLDNILREYEPFDEMESRHKKNLVEWLCEAVEPLDRNCFQPGHVVGSGFIVSPTINQFVLIHNRRLNRWLQPGGHVESYDIDIADTVRREVMEEVGIKLNPYPSFGSVFDIDVHRIPETVKEPSHLHFDIRFIFIVEHTELKPGSDIRTSRWVTRLEAESLDLDASITRMITKCVRAGFLL